MQFLRGQFDGRFALRPPWAMEESRFTSLCERCDACIKSCHAKIIQRGASGFPEINFSRSGCDFCQACVQACHTGALALTVHNHHQPWSIQAQIGSNCLSERGVICRACGDVCETRAIRFRLAVGGSSRIEFDASACNGCGECVSRCPVNAIEMNLNHNAELSHE
jgi:ferredoxin-type protein NapF